MKMKRALILAGCLALVGCHRSRLTGGGDDNATPPDVKAVWIGNINADGQVVSFDFNLGPTAGGSLLGTFYGISQGTISGTLGVNGDMSFVLDEGSNCQDKPTGTGHVVGNTMTISIAGPSDCAIHFTTIAGTIYRNGKA